MPRKRHDPALAIAYLRVSTDAETQELGMDAQKAAILAFALRENLTISAWFSDEASGGANLDKRPGLLGAVEAVRTTKAAILLVQKRDRYTRDSRQTAPVDLALEKMGARLVSADGQGNGSDPTAQLLAGLLDSFSKYERAQIATRIKAALAVKRGRGERISRFAPYGFSFDTSGNLSPNPSEAETLRIAADLRRSGLTLKGISAELANRGRLNRAGKPFALSALHLMTA